MPPRARLRLSAATRLDRQLEFAGADALRRHALRAESLVREIPRDALVSEAWLVERLTGVRSRDADTGATLVGQAVAMDSAALALRWSERGPLRPEDLPGGAIALEEAARRMGVTVRSLQRWRRQGLVSVRVRFGRSVRSAISGETLAWAQRELVAKRPTRTRDPARRERLVDVARSIVASGASLHAASRAVASATGASVSTVRRALVAAERSGALPRLTRRETPGARTRSAAWRAWRRGAGLAEVAEPLARSSAATLRLIRRERRDRLRSLRLQVPALPTFTRADAADTLLAPKSVRSGLAARPWPHEARGFLRRFPPGVPGADRAWATDAQRLVALRFLLWRVEREIAALRGSDPGAGLDRAEANLRWAARLKVSLVENALPGALGRLQAMRAGPLTGLPSSALRRAIVAAVSAAGEVVAEAMLSEHAIERPRLAALAAATVERAVAGASWLRPGAASRESEVTLPPSLRDSVTPWVEWVPLRDDLAELAAADRGHGARVLERRFGWDGAPPLSGQDAAQRLGMDARHAGKIAAEAFRRLRAVPVGR
ncbi:MAG: hypothetical protein FJ292_04525 [Planctomycetes bacterium]|nr:hypothetical protein [Planctomycetota bacterium]